MIDDEITLTFGKDNPTDNLLSTYSTTAIAEIVIKLNLFDRGNTIKNKHNICGSNTAGKLPEKIVTIPGNRHYMVEHVINCIHLA